MSKRRGLLKWIVLIGSVCFFAYFSLYTYRFLTTPLSTSPIHYLFEPGASVRRLASDLQQRQLLIHPRFFLLLAYLKGAAGQLKAGEYYFNAGITASQLLDQIRAGQMIVHRFTIVEGWTVQQLMKALHTSPYIECSAQENWNQLFAESGLPRQNPEGLFFPATYYFSLQTTDRDLLKRAYQLLDKKLNAAWQQRANNLPYKTPYEALVAASLVEKETALSKERPMIAGVIARRLEKGIPLQIDASVIYGLGTTYFGKLTSEDLKKDTAYNTYTRRGLPPTPIAIPSLNSIEAVFHPDQSHNLYFVAKGDGSHQFSSDLLQHNEAVKRYHLDRHYPKITPKILHCESQWYLSQRMKLFFCQLEERTFKTNPVSSENVKHLPSFLPHPIHAKPKVLQSIAAAVPKPAHSQPRHLTLKRTLPIAKVDSLQKSSSSAKKRHRLPKQVSMNALKKKRTHVNKATVQIQRGSAK